MRNQRRVTACVSILTSIILMTGCSAVKSDTGGDVLTKEKKSNQISIMLNLHTAELPSNTLKELIEQKTDTKLDINFIPDGVYDEKFQTAQATEGLSQISYVGNLNSFIKVRGAIKNGQFWEIGPYLSNYPNLSKLSPEVLNNMKVDGKLYTLYQEVPLARQGVIYRKDWADQLGLPAPESIDDIYNMLKKFKESGLTTIPMADRNDLIYGSFKTLSSYFGTPNNWGLIDGQLTPDFMTQEYMDTMNFLKKLRDEGLINQDFPVTSKTDQMNLIMSGKSGLYIGSMAGVDGLEEKTQANVKEAKYDVENRILGVNGKPGVWAVPGYGSPVLFPKSAIEDEEELKRILAFCDKLFDPEIANLLIYGVEGTHYTLKDGKVVLSSDAKLLEKDIAGYSGFALSRITNILPKVYERPVGEKSEQLTKLATDFAIADPTTALESKTNEEKGARLRDIISDATYKFILGDINEDGFKDAIRRWQDQGGNSIIEEYNISYTSANGS